MTTRIPVSVFFALFTISGFAGLIYESIWSHYLKLFLGHAAYAQTLVLAIFMGGMALGSWLVSRYTNRIRNLLLGYAFAELGIGLLAIVFHQVFVSLSGWAFDTVIPALGGSTAVDVFKWSLASLLILPASVLLGTTFPLMSAGIIRLYPGDSGRALSMLYFTNSLGASIGVLASGFVLIHELGLPGTILTAGILNVCLAIFVWGLTKRLPEVAPAAPAAHDGSGPPRAAFRAVLLLAFVTGAASFIYEITWIRMLSMGLGASTHAFEVMLAAFILGMSLGGYALRNRIGSLVNDTGWLSGILVAKGLFAIGAIWVYGHVLGYISWAMSGLSPTDAGYAFLTLNGLVSSMLVMLPTAFCAGMTLPLATNALIRRGYGESAIGAVYGANTLGCIVGAAFTTHVGMELLGVKGLTGLGATMDIGIGAVLVLALASPGQRRAAYPRIGAAVAAGVVAFTFFDLDQLRMASGIFRGRTFMDPQHARVEWYRDGKTATIAVTRDHNVLVIRTNGKPDASVELVDRSRPTQDEATMILAAAIPIAMKPDATEIANIGFGSGLTTHALLGSDNARVVDSIEIESAMIEGARAFGARNERAYRDPRSRIHIEDAKTFFAAHGKTYDIIVSEPSNPWVSGVSTLFSEEFYSQVRRYLKDDGLLVQWIQVYEINPALVATVFRALGESFSDYVIHMSSAGDMIVVAAKTGKVPEMRPDFLAFPRLGEELAGTGFRSLADLRATRVASRAALDPLFHRLASVANSDFFPILDQNAARSLFKNESALDVQMLARSHVSMIPFVDGDRRVRRASLLREDKLAPISRRQAEAAAEAYDIFFAGTPSGPRWLEPSGRTIFMLARAGTIDCRLESELWVEALEDFFRFVIPVLAEQDVEAAFERLRLSPCAKGLSDDQRRRLDLLRAVNQLDPAAMSTQAEALLAVDTPRKAQERLSFVLTAMVGNIVNGAPDRAIETWNRHVGRIPDKLAELPSSQLIVAHALQARKTAATKTAPKQ